MQITKFFNERKALTHRWLFIAQIFSPVLMLIGANYQLTYMIILGLVILVAANAIAILIK